jgi:hypothetical protein
MDEAFLVQAPIRYGRLSENRGNTYPRMQSSYQAGAHSGDCEWMKTPWLLARFSHAGGRKTRFRHPPKTEFSRQGQ